MEEFDLVIIGGGISGMSLAHFCARQGLSVCVLEKDSHPGGAIHSERCLDDFWLELGTHTCYNSYGNLLEIIEEVGLTDKLLKREKAPWLIWEGGRTGSILGKLHLGELLFSLPRLFWLKKSGLSVEEYYSRIFGRRNYRDVIGPVLSAVPSQDAGPFPAEMLFKKRPRRKDIVRSYTMEGGLQTIPDAIAREDKVTLVCNCEARKVDYQGGVFKTTVASGMEYQARALALAAPPAVTVGLLQGVVDGVASPLAGLKVNQTDSTGVVVRSSDTSLPRLAGLVAKGEPFYSMVSRDTVPHPAYRGFVFHFKIGMEEEERKGAMARVLGVPEEKWLHMASRKNVIPSPVIGHHRLVDEIDRQLAGRPLLLTGNFFAGMAVEDCVERSVREAERLMALGNLKNS